MRESCWTLALGGRGSREGASEGESERERMLDLQIDHHRHRPIRSKHGRSSQVPIPIIRSASLRHVDPTE